MYLPSKQASISFPRCILVPHSAPTFSRFLIEVEDRTLIRSVCDDCGAWEVLSHHDGSLETWEDEHICSADAAGAGE